MRRLFLCLALLALALSTACVDAQVVGNGGYGALQGNDPTNCYNFVQRSRFMLGNSTNFPYSDQLMNPTALPITGLDTSSAGVAGGTGMQTTFGFDPCSPVGQWVMVYTHVSGTGTYNPYVLTGTFQSGATSLVQFASDTTNTNNAGHDAPSVLDLPGNYAMLAYGGISTNKSYTPPASWQDTDLGGTNPYNARMPFLWGNSTASTGSGWGNSANKYFLPIPGYSEPASACLTFLIGQACLATGQAQTNSVGTYTFSYSGEQTGLTYRIQDYNGGACFDVVDRANSNAYSCKPYNYATTGQAWGTLDGDMRIMQTPASDQYMHFVLTGTSVTTTNSYSITINGCTQSVSLTAGDTPDTVASKVATQFQSNCANTNFFTYSAATATILSVTPSSCRVKAGAQGCVVVTFLPAKGYNNLTAPGATSFSVAGITDNGDVTDYGNSGNRHFIWGGPIAIPQLGVYALLSDVEVNTTSAFGTLSNSNALWLNVMLSTGPNAVGQWTWTDISGNNPYVTAPGTAPAAYYGIGPGGSCTYNADCQVPTGAANGYTTNPYAIRPPQVYPTNMAPFCYDAGTIGQNSCMGSGASLSIPVMSQESIIYDKVSDSFFISFPSFCNCGGAGLASVTVLQVARSTKLTTAYLVPFASSNTLQNDVAATQLIEDVNGNISLIIGSGFAGKTIGCTSGYGTCILRSRFTRGTGFGATSVLAGPLGGGTLAQGNTQGSVVQFVSDPLARNTYCQCWYGNVTATASPGPTPSPNPISVRVFNP